MLAAFAQVGFDIPPYLDYGNMLLFHSILLYAESTF